MEKLISSISDAKIIELLKLDDSNYTFGFAPNEVEIDEYSIIRRTEQYIEIERYSKNVWISVERIDQNKLNEMLGQETKIEEEFLKLKELLDIKRINASTKIFTIFLLKKLYSEGFIINGKRNIEKSTELLKDIMTYHNDKTIIMNAIENRQIGQVTIIDGEALFLLFDMLEDMSISIHKRNFIGNFQITINIKYI